MLYYNSMSKNNKFILEIFNDDGSSKSKTEYKTLREISAKLGDGIEYHQIRSIYLQSKKKTKLHPTLASIYKQIKISDNPNSKIVLNFNDENNKIV